MIPIRKGRANKLKPRYLLIYFLFVSIFLYPLLSTGKRHKALGQGVVFASEVSKQEKTEPLWKMFKLVGTVCSDDRKLNLAIIESSEAMAQAVYHIGSKLPNGAKIKSIFTDHVLLERDAEKKVLKITGGSGFDQEELNSKGYQKISSNKWIVNPNKLFKSIEDIAKLCRDIKIKKMGEGFLIDYLGDNEFLKELGIQEGDIIRKTNGRGFDSLYDALEYIWNLEDDSSLNIEIARNDDEYNLELYPSYAQQPSYVETGSITPQRINSMLKAEHVFKRANVVYK